MGFWLGTVNIGKIEKKTTATTKKCNIDSVCVIHITCTESIKKKFLFDVVFDWVGNEINRFIRIGDGRAFGMRIFLLCQNLYGT